MRSAIAIILLALVCGCGTTVKRAADKQIAESVIDHAERDPAAAQRMAAIVEPYLDFGAVLGQSVGRLAKGAVVEYWQEGAGLAVLAWMLREVRKARANVKAEVSK